MNSNIFYSTQSDGLQQPQEPPRDDLEAAEHGGGAIVPKPTPPEPLSVDQSSVIKAEMMAWKAKAEARDAQLELTAQKLADAETEASKLQKMLKDARREAGGYRTRLRACEADLETERAKVSHLRGIAGRVEEDEAA